MNQYVVGTVIKNLRENRKLTQLELAEMIMVSDKTISKWETGRGYPDITLLEPLAKSLDVSVIELLKGSPVRNENVSSNMLKSNFYICPVCGNVIHSMGQIAVSCHGISLAPSLAEEPDEDHKCVIETVEDEYYVSIEHEMTKMHHISFIAAVSSDQIQMVKLYPEGNAEGRFKKAGVKCFYYYCNKDGLYRMSP